MFSTRDADNLPEGFNLDSEVPFCSHPGLRYLSLWSQIFICVYVLILITRLYRYFQLYPFLGPLVVGVRKMIVEVFKFFVIFILCIYGYGVLQGVLMYPGRFEQSFVEWLNWLGFIMIGKGFFHIFAELYDDEIGLTVFHGFEAGCVSALDPSAYNKDSENFEAICPSAHWTSLVFMALYVLMLRFNLLVSVTLYKRD